MSQFTLSSQDYSFSSPLPLQCEGAFYNLADQLAAHTPSDPTASPYLSDFTRLIHQVAGSLHSFCKLPVVEDTPNAISHFIKFPGQRGIARGESDGRPYLVFKAQVTGSNTKETENATLKLSMEKDYSWTRTFISKDQRVTVQHAVKNEKNQFQRFLKASEHKGVLFKGFDKPIAVLGKREFEKSNQCELNLIAKMEKYGIADKVKHFFLQVMGGMHKLCKLRYIPCTSQVINSLDDTFYTIPQTIFRIRQPNKNAFEVAFRICEVVDQLQPNGLNKRICASDFYCDNPDISSFHEIEKRAYESHKVLPFFIFARVDHKLQNLALQLYSNTIQNRPASPDDLKALSLIANNHSSTFPGLLGSIVRISTPSMHLANSFGNEEVPQL